MQETMTETEARTFDRGVSVASIVAAEHPRECDCEAYIDIFTFRRWKAQGFVVRKGQHGTKCTTWIAVQKRDITTGESTPNGTRPKRYTVFCRCQVNKVTA